MKFWVELAPPPWKVGNASHFINVERRLKQQVAFLRDLRDNKKVIEAGPFAILNAPAPKGVYMINTESWESLSRTLHQDPMFYLQAPQISYLADWEEAMAKHADTAGSEHGLEDLENDVRTDLGLNLQRQPQPEVEILRDQIRDQSREIQMLRGEIETLIRRLGETKR